MEFRVNIKNQDIIKDAMETDSVEYSISETITKFTNKLYQNIDKASVVVTGIGVLVELSIIGLATMGLSLKEIKKLLNRTFNVDEIEFMIDLVDVPTCTFDTIIIINNDINPNKIFCKMADSICQCIISKNIDSDLKKINEYYDDISNGIIKMVTQSIDAESLSVAAINVFYLRSSWAQPFDPNKTFRAAFHKTPGNMIDLMHQTNFYNYYEDSNVQLIELPFHETDMVMGFILPKKYMDETNINYTPNNVPYFTTSQILEFINNTKYTYVDVYIPKFTHVQYNNLGSTIQKMGINKILDENKPIKMISDNAYLSSVDQITVVTIDETGYISYTKTDLNNGYSNIVFRADHVFVYYIKDIASGMIITMGDYQGDSK